MDIKTETHQLSKEFRSTQKLLNAMGDEMRQQIILIMLEHCNCLGLRANEIAEYSRLSRPAVSHHLQIMKDAGLIKMHREGTKNYYYFDADMEAMDALIGMLTHAREIMQALSDRTSEN